MQKGFNKYNHVGQKCATTLSAIFVLNSNIFKIILKPKIISNYLKKKRRRKKAPCEGMLLLVVAIAGGSSGLTMNSVVPNCCQID